MKRGTRPALPPSHCKENFSVNDASLVFDVDERTFDAMVVEASRRGPVMVDYWAAWCGPCRALAPVLEDVVKELGGRVRLAKLNTDQNQRLAAAHGIRSLPTVKLFVNGGVVDEFFGAYPKAQVREFLTRHLKDEPDALGEKVQALVEAGQGAQAVELLRKAIEAMPEKTDLRLRLAAVLIAGGDLDAADETLKGLSEEARQQPAAKRLAALLHFHRLCDGAPSSDDLRDTVARQPGDLQARLQLGARRVLEQDYDAALEQLLSVLGSDRSFRDDMARKSMLLIFELLGARDPRVSRYRSRLAAALY